MKKIIEKLKAVGAGTIIRTILQFLVYVNQFVALLGMKSFADSPIYQWITFGITIVITVLSYWFNNDWTNGALLVKDVFDMLKDGKVTPEEIQAFVAKYKNQEEIKKIDNKEAK